MLFYLKYIVLNEPLNSPTPFLLSKIYVWIILEKYVNRFAAGGYLTFWDYLAQMIKYYRSESLSWISYILGLCCLYLFVCLFVFFNSLLYHDLYVLEDDALIS